MGAVIDNIWGVTLLCACVVAGGCSSGIDGDDGDGGGSSGPTYLPADGVTITAIDIYQSVKSPLMQGGAPAGGGVAVIAGKDALMRIHYVTDGTYNGKPVLGRLQIAGGGGGQGEEPAPLTAQANLGPTSNEADLGSTVNIAIPAAALAPGGVGYSVELVQAAATSSGQNLGARYPAVEGVQDVLPTYSTGPQLRVVLVPIAYGGDGSNRLPDTTEAQLELVRRHLYQLYPVVEVTIEVASPLQWNAKVQANGNGWVPLLDAMMKLRGDDPGAEPDEYYYGVLNPAESFPAFCTGGCLAGLSMLAGPTDDFARVGIGLGFTGPESADTAAHEIGHQHGLSHAPCQTSGGLDPAYPQQDGSIGSYGYDLLGGTLVPPGHKDFMSYCNPDWIGPYHYGKLFERIKLVNGASIFPGETRAFDRLLIGLDGEVLVPDSRGLGPITLRRPPLGPPVPVTLGTRAGPIEVLGYHVPFSHGGGVVLVAVPDP